VPSTFADTISIRTITDTKVEALLSLAQVRAAVGVSQSTLTRIIASGELPVISIGRRLLVDPADLRAFLAGRRRRGSGGRNRPGLAPRVPALDRSTSDEAPVAAEASVEEIADAARVPITG
jgi:excisionase family DNA binding protein